MHKSREGDRNDFDCKVISTLTIISNMNKTGGFKAFKDSVDSTKINLWNKCPKWFLWFIFMYKERKARHRCAKRRPINTH